MIGAILAGGYGKRLKPITDEIPKALVQIRENYTIMDRQIFDFANMGVKDIYILSGYLGEKIEERYGNEHSGMRFHYLREQKPLGTLFSLRNLLNEKADDDIILRNGDTVTDLNFNRFIKFAQQSAYGIVMFVTRMKSPFGIVDMLGDQITQFKEKPFLNYFINAGIYYLKKETFNLFFEEYIDKEIETTIFPRLANQKLAGAYTEETMWLGIDSEKDLEQIRREHSNRTDYVWGYRKALYWENGKGMDEYFVKADEKFPMELGDSSIIRIMNGSGGVYSDGGVHKFSSHDVIHLSGKISMEPHENTRFEVISI